MKTEHQRETPIIFSGEMVRAILEGRKTLTRRVIRKQPIGAVHELKYEPGIWADFKDPVERLFACPYGQPGDRLWVRETWMPRITDSEELIQYKADGGLRDFPKGLNLPEDLLYEYVRGDGQRWRPSIFMPRWASRITLEIVSVRVERVQEISEDDASREGVWPCSSGSSRYPSKHPYIRPFQRVWDSLNAKRGYGWEVNPWVWVIEFPRLTRRQQQ